jgi:anti-anti-sigma factor
VTDDAQPAAADLVEVHLVGLPLQVHAEAGTHMEALQRELDLIRHGELDQSTVPHRLRALVDELEGQFSGFGDELSQALEAGVERGDTTIDVSYRLPPAAGDAARRLCELLDAADEYCRAGDHLLTVVTPPGSVRYRRWFLGEFERQTAGLPARTWAEFLDGAPVPGPEATASGETGETGRATERRTIELPTCWSLDRSGDAAVLKVTGPLDLESAPALREALVELIAAPLVTVDLTGCDFLDSVGVSVLLAAVARAAEHGTAVSFRLSDAASRVLGITGLLDRLPIEA